MPVPMGRPLELSDKQLEILSQVDDVDIEMSKLLVKEGSKILTEIMDAPVLEDLNAQG